MSIHFFTEFWFYHNPWISNLDLVIQIFGIEPSPPVRVIRSNDNGIQEQGWVWQYFMRRPACFGQVYRCPRGSLGVPIWAASDYLEEFVILPIQAIQAIHLCWVWDRDQRVGSKGPPRVLSKSQVRRGVSNGSTDRLGAPGNSGIKVCLKNEIFLSKPVLQSGGG